VIHFEVKISPLNGEKDSMVSNLHQAPSTTKSRISDIYKTNTGGFMMCGSAYNQNRQKEFDSLGYKDTAVVINEWMIMDA
jgi:hypothetical protein